MESSLKALIDRGSSARRTPCEHAFDQRAMAPAAGPQTALICGAGGARAVARIPLAPRSALLGIFLPSPSWG